MASENRLFVSRETIKAEKLLTRGLKEISLVIKPERLEALIEYSFLIYKYNQKVRLVGYRSIEKIINNLILDSLLFFQTRISLDGQRALDVGTGAGIPSVPIKICFNNWFLDLIEPAAKKAAFLLKVKRELSIKNTQVFPEKLEKLSGNPEKAGNYNLAFSRAFGDPNLLLGHLRPLLEVGGLVVLYQGEETARETKEALGRKGVDGYELYRQLRLEFSFLSHPRFLTILKRI